MAMSSSTGGPDPSLMHGFHLGEFEVEPSLNRVIGPDRTTRLEPKIMAVLVCLAQRPGRLVRRQEIVDRVWGEAGATDDVVSRCVSELRRVFGDDARDARVIETIPKAGYRLIPPVRSGSPGPPPAAVVESSPPHAEGRRRVSPYAVAAVVTISVVVLTLLNLRSPSASGADASSGPPTIRPLGSLPGQPVHPALSPDGGHVAYAWQPDSSRWDLYLLAVGEGVPTPITATADAAELSPSWSPDGGHLAFVRAGGGFCGLVVRALESGRERVVAECEEGSFRRVVWSRDGDHLLVVTRPPDGVPTYVTKVGIDGRDPLHGILGPPTPVSSPPPGTLGDVTVAGSPDGRQFVTARLMVEGVADLFLIDLGTGETRQLTHDGAAIYGAAWTADGSILFASNRKDRHGLWRIHPNDGVVEWVILTGGAAFDVSVTAAGGHVVFRRDQFDVDLHRYTVSASGEWADSAFHTVARSTRAESKPRVSPTGRHLVYESNRDGFYELWVRDLRTGADRQLTRLRGPYNGSARWSPDGRLLVFDGRPSGRADIFLADVESGAVQPVVTDAAQDAVPSWSLDGGTLYFASNRSGDWQIWSVPAAGGEATQITRGGGYTGIESPDGYLYYARVGEAGLWRVDREGGGDEVKVMDQPGPGDFDAWALTPGGVVYLERRPDGDRVMSYDFDRRVHRVLGPVGEIPRYSGGLDISADGAMVFVSVVERVGSELMVIEGIPNHTPARVSAVVGR